MALKVKTTPRVFKFKNGTDDVKVGDPNPAFSIDEVISFLANTYPSLTNSSMTGPEIKGGEAVYTVSSSFGSKG